MPPKKRELKEKEIKEVKEQPKEELKEETKEEIKEVNNEKDLDWANIKDSSDEEHKPKKNKESVKKQSKKIMKEQNNSSDENIKGKKVKELKEVKEVKEVKENNIEIEPLTEEEDDFVENPNNSFNKRNKKDYNLERNTNKKESVLNFDRNEIQKLDNDRLSDIDNKTLLKVMMTRAMNNDNPSLYYKISNILKEISFERKAFNKFRQSVRKPFNKYESRNNFKSNNYRNEEENEESNEFNNKKYYKDNKESKDVEKQIQRYPSGNTLKVRTTKREFQPRTYKGKEEEQD